MTPMPPLVYLGLTMAFTVVGGGMVLTSVKAHWRASCSRCGYDLRGHAHATRCPECGEAFEVVPDGYIERRPRRFICGVALLCLAVGAFCLMLLSMIR